MANSYPVTLGPAITFWQLGGSYQSEGPPCPVDTLIVIAIRIQNYLQRPYTNTGVVSGKVFNTEGIPVTLKSIGVALDIAGPFTDAIIMTGDPEYSFPAIGSPGGTAFAVPIEIPILVSDYLYLKIEMDY
jgi:hypothetical protein